MQRFQTFGWNLSAVYMCRRIMYLPMAMNSQSNTVRCTHTRMDYFILLYALTISLSLVDQCACEMPHYYRFPDTDASIVVPAHMHTQTHTHTHTAHSHTHIVSHVDAQLWNRGRCVTASPYSQFHRRELSERKHLLNIFFFKHSAAAATTRKSKIYLLYIWLVYRYAYIYNFLLSSL